MNKSLKKRFVTIFSIFLSVGVVLGALLISLAIILQTTVYSTDYYEKATKADNYIPMLKQAIRSDLLAQSSYVAVPIESLAAGLIDDKLKESLNNHTQNVVDFFMYKKDFIKSSYPEDLFYKQLEIFINIDGEKNDYIPSEEQYVLLHEVAKDSSEMVIKHVNILNLNLLKDMTAFKNLQHFIFKLRNLLLPSLGLLIVSLAVLLILHRKDISRALLFCFSGIWIFGTLMLVPSIVLEMFGITRRLAIKTPYLKFAIDTWLTNINHIVMKIGVVAFGCATIVLLARIIIGKKSPDIT